LFNTPPFGQGLCPYYHLTMTSSFSQVVVPAILSAESPVIYHDYIENTFAHGAWFSWELPEYTVKRVYIKDPPCSQGQVWEFCTLCRYVLIVCGTN